MGLVKILDLVLGFFHSLPTSRRAVEEKSPKRIINRVEIPSELEPVRLKALKAIAPIRQWDESTSVPADFWDKAGRTIAGRELPNPQLIYFLLVDLLGFSNLGRREKVAWIVPVDFHGVGFVIEHRKLGVGVFIPNPGHNEEMARAIVELIKKGVATAEPFFDWMAKNAIQESKVNVWNHSSNLFDRLEMFMQMYKSSVADVEKFCDSFDENAPKKDMDDLVKLLNLLHEKHIKQLESSWIGLAVIEAFFSWTEHVFVLLAIIEGKIKTALEVSKLSEAPWGEKYKTVLNISDQKSKLYLDEMLIIRKQLRNFVAHGAFGKKGEAFLFHSPVGAIPVRLPRIVEQQIFKISGENEFIEEKAIKLIEEFIDYLWSGDREPAKLYIQDSMLPLVLPWVSKGRYKRAMGSIEEMEAFIMGVNRHLEIVENMDW